MPIGWSATERKKKLDELERKALGMNKAPAKKPPSDSSTVPSRPLPKASAQAVSAREAAIKAQQEADRKALIEMAKKKKTGY